mmetsp:Transcript_27072/g.81159  ORF Transcript_27072/g.81159 Transcript_27072/m.81159 type:complete len:88 (+) Transcript_27072:120-383(+)
MQQTQLLMCASLMAPRFFFRLGKGEVIKGWDLGLLGMCVGEVRRIVVPSDMAYGHRGVAPFVPADADLVYEIEVASIWPDGSIKVPI